MTTIAVDGLSEEDFRRAIENRLREGKPGAALERLRRLLAPYCGPGRVLPERFLAVTSANLSLTGWEGLANAVGAHDRPGHCITALSIAFGWPGDDAPQPDLAGRLRPHLETSYYTDEAFPFSQSDRDDLLDGYSFHGCTWAADCEATDNALGLSGIDDLYGALGLLEARLLVSAEPSPDELLAGSLGACLLSVLLFQAVGERIERDGLPRPLCVTAGSNGVYPYFDAPVAGIPEDKREAAEAALLAVEALHAAPAPRYSSLLMTGIPRAAKRAVLVLEESEQDTQARIAKLRGLNHEDRAAPPPAREAEGEELGLPLPAPELAASAGSPLMIKKPSGQTWDFRDMLSPRDADAPSPEPMWSEPVEPVDLGDSRLPEPPPPDQDAAEPPVFEPHAFDPPESEPQEPELLGSPWSEPGEAEPPRYVPGTDELVQPGFSLLDPQVQDRLESLIAANLPAPAATLVADLAPAPITDLQAGPYWPSGRGWLDDDDTPAEPPPPLPEAAVEEPRPGLWARLRGWLRR